MLTNDLDFRLEPRLKELYEQHKVRAKKIDWSYHEFLPWDKGIDFKRVPWDQSQVTLPSGIITAVETALLTEVNLPWFTTYLSETFKGSLSVITDFIHTWTSEEDQHSNLLETYLLLTRNVNPNRLHELRKQVLEDGFEPDFHTPIEAMAYTTLQELATMVFYNNVAKIAGNHDRELATLLHRLAKDETLHYAFYRDVIRAHLELEPNYCYHIANVIIHFKMPGAVMPDFENRMGIIAREANYGPLQYFDQVLDVVVDYWGLRDLRPIAPEAEQARLQILEYHARLKRVRDRYGKVNTSMPRDS
ncbi:putative acyl-[acyl-carrier protein] desaturase [Collibacillus ludicampi]|uniref:Acyl-[acyl-carrier protein] desaturase n=1 Tax=Collibacillus ludicampi TaxID=2771369 RepID=A0AAV4LJN8_9BACL|nr:acyl-ACP desaturase [Collibacillus ludicampi]GIM48080.1 putative acyl-[acyl-carrier protein] desaturase [Collibacillus ludicampi]